VVDRYIGWQQQGMAAANDDEQPTPETGSLLGLRVLVVEDSWHVATAIQSFLGSFGADVAGPVASTVDAERLLAEQLPDVAIIDINLRGGALASDLIEKLHDLAVRVIVVSGYSAAPGQSRCRLAEAHR